mmetsp:Transcript_18759/g.46899  ORF Transcript_18759/g.46899 Transcript_18759/m.46899 type:complete len:1563 (+) Transcript_18759:218-4906(+)
MPSMSISTTMRILEATETYPEVASRSFLRVVFLRETGDVWKAHLQERQPAGGQNKQTPSTTSTCAAEYAFPIADSFLRYWARFATRIRGACFREDEGQGEEDGSTSSTPGGGGSRSSIGIAVLRSSRQKTDTGDPEDEGDDRHNDGGGAVLSHDQNGGALHDCWRAWLALLSCLSGFAEPSSVAKLPVELLFDENFVVHELGFSEAEGARRFVLDALAVAGVLVTAPKNIERTSLSLSSGGSQQAESGNHDRGSSSGCHLHLEDQEDDELRLSASAVLSLTSTCLEDSSFAPLFRPAVKKFRDHHESTCSPDEQGRASSSAGSKATTAGATTVAQTTALSKTTAAAAASPTTSSGASPMEVEDSEKAVVDVLVKKRDSSFSVQKQNEATVEDDEALPNDEPEPSLTSFYLSPALDERACAVVVRGGAEDVDEAEVELGKSSCDFVICSASAATPPYSSPSPAPRSRRSLIDIEFESRDLLCSPKGKAASGGAASSLSPRQKHESSPFDSQWLSDHALSASVVRLQQETHTEEQEERTCSGLSQEHLEVLDSHIFGRSFCSHREVVVLEDAVLQDREPPIAGEPEAEAARAAEVAKGIIDEEEDLHDGSSCDEEKLLVALTSQPRSSPLASRTRFIAGDHDDVSDAVQCDCTRLETLLFAAADYTTTERETKRSESESDEFPLLVVERSEAEGRSGDDTTSPSLYLSALPHRGFDVSLEPPSSCGPSSPEFVSPAGEGKLHPDSPPCCGEHDPLQLDISTTVEASTGVTAAEAASGVRCSLPTPAQECDSLTILAGAGEMKVEKNDCVATVLEVYPVDDKDVELETPEQEQQDPLPPPRTKETGTSPLHQDQAGASREDNEVVWSRSAEGALEIRSLEKERAAKAELRTRARNIGVVTKRGVAPGAGTVVSGGAEADINKSCSPRGPPVPVKASYSSSSSTSSTTAACPPKAATLTAKARNATAGRAVVPVAFMDGGKTREESSRYSPLLFLGKTPDELVRDAKSGQLDGLQILNAKLDAATSASTAFSNYYSYPSGGSRLLSSSPKRRQARARRQFLCDDFLGPAASDPDTTLGDILADLRRESGSPEYGGRTANESKLSELLQSLERDPVCQGVGRELEQDVTMSSTEEVVVQETESDRERSQHEEFAPAQKQKETSRRCDPAGQEPATDVARAAASTDDMILVVHGAALQGTQPVWLTEAQNANYGKNVALADHAASESTSTYSSRAGGKKQNDADEYSYDYWEGASDVMISEDVLSLNKAAAGGAAEANPESVTLASPTPSSHATHTEDDPPPPAVRVDVPRDDQGVVEKDATSTTTKKLPDRRRDNVFTKLKTGTQAHLCRPAIVKAGASSIPRPPNKSSALRLQAPALEAPQPSDVQSEASDRAPQHLPSGTIDFSTLLLPNVADGSSSCSSASIDFPGTLTRGAVTTQEPPRSGEDGRACAAADAKVVAILDDRIEVPLAVAAAQRRAAEYKQRSQKEDQERRKRIEEQKAKRFRQRDERIARFVARRAAALSGEHCCTVHEEMPGENPEERGCEVEMQELFAAAGAAAASGQILV